MDLAHLLVEAMDHEAMDLVLQMSGCWMCCGLHIPPVAALAPPLLLNQAAVGLAHDLQKVVVVMEQVEQVGQWSRRN